MCAAPPARGLHARRLSRLLSVLRRPWRVAKTVALVTRGELEQRLDGAWMPIDPRVRVADARKTRRHGGHREIGGIAHVDLVPGHRRGNARIGPWPHGVGGCDGAILCVLVEIDEHAVPFLFPPLAGSERGRATLDVTREREGGAAHLEKRPSPLDPDVDMNAA